MVAARGQFVDTLNQRDFGSNRTGLKKVSDSCDEGVTPKMFLEEIKIPLPSCHESCMRLLLVQQESCSLGTSLALLLLLLVSFLDSGVGTSVALRLLLFVYTHTHTHTNSLSLSLIHTNTHTHTHSL